MEQHYEIKNLRLLSHHDLNGHGNIGEGIALQQRPSGQRVLYLAHESPPLDVTTVDVTDPLNPRVMCQTKLPHREVRSNSLAVVDSILLVAYQVARPGLSPAGMGIYDVSNPEKARQLSFFDTSGPASRGAHFVWCVDGWYAHLSTGAPDFKPTYPLDDQFYMIVDIGDPTLPTEVGRWWLPGTREGDDVPPPSRHPIFDAGFAYTTPMSIPSAPIELASATLMPG